VIESGRKRRIKTPGVNKASMI